MDGFTVGITADQRLRLVVHNISAPHDETAAITVEDTTPLPTNEWVRVEVSLTPTEARLTRESLSLTESVSSEALWSVPFVRPWVRYVVGGQASVFIDDLRLTPVKPANQLIALEVYDEQKQEYVPMKAPETKLDERGEAAVRVKSVGSLNEVSSSVGGEVVNLSIEATLDGSNPYAEEPEPRELEVFVGRTELMGELIHLATTMDEESLRSFTRGVIYGACQAKDRRLRGENPVWCTYGLVASSFFPPTALYASMRDTAVYMAGLYGMRSVAPKPEWWEGPFAAVDALTSLHGLAKAGGAARRAWTKYKGSKLADVPVGMKNRIGKHYEDAAKRGDLMDELEPPKGIKCG
jgi:hypothetical protein